MDPLSHEISIVKWSRDQGAKETTDSLAQEEPLEIRLRGRAVSVTMRTPGHDEELAAGFLLSEGLIHAPSDIVRIEHCDQNDQGNVLNVVLSPLVNIDFDKLTRHVFASSSCGLCGKATIDSIHGQFTPIQSDLTISATIIQRLPEIMRQHQQTFAQTGGLHAAALFDVQGNLLLLREDIGRHNALDKLLGHSILNPVGLPFPLDRHVLLVSGRASFEIMQKALAGRIPIIAAISAPSTLAVDFAQESNQTLIGFLRDGRMNVYSHPQRIQFS